jgi:hypothetical protein
MFKYKKKKKNPYKYLERQALDHSGKSPSFLVPCLKPSAHCAPSLPSSPYPLPANKTFIYIQTTLTCPLLLGHTNKFSAFLAVPHTKIHKNWRTVNKSVNPSPRF